MEGAGAERSCPPAGAGAVAGLPAGRQGPAPGGGCGGAVLRAARPGDGPAAAGPLWRRKAQTLTVTTSAALSRVCPKSTLPDF